VLRVLLDANQPTPGKFALNTGFNAEDSHTQSWFYIWLSTNHFF